MIGSGAYVEPGFLGAYDDVIELILSGNDASSYETLSLAAGGYIQHETANIGTCYHAIAEHAIWTPWPT